MKQKKFLSLLKKYLDGDLTGKAKDYVDDWFSAIGKEDSAQLLTQEEEEALKTTYQQAVYRRISVEGTVKSRFPRWQAMSIAASLLIVSLVGVYWFVLDGSPSRENETLSFESVTNNGSSDLLVDLPDGSKVTLLSGGELKYFKENNSSTRTVYLSGKAFFEVTKNPEKPFLVHTNKITTRVVGTSFRIESDSNGDAVKVAVVTGSVSVFESSNENKAGQQVVLTPNQQIIYSAKDKQLVSELVEAPVMIPEIRKKYGDVSTVFQDAPAREVFEAMEKLYGIPIFYDADQFKNCRITTTLEIGDFYNRLSIVCEVLDASYSNEGVSIRLVGKGCPVVDDKD